MCIRDRFEQDANYAKALIEAKRQYGFPKRFYVSFSKKSDERVFNITKAFNEANMLQGATLSFQSLNEATLEAIGRKNMGLEKFCGLSLIHIYTVNRSLKNTGITVTGGLDQRYEAFINNILNDYRAGRKITKTEADVDDKSTVPLLSLSLIHIYC